MIVLGFWMVFLFIDLINQVCSFDDGVCSAVPLGVGNFVELIACHDQSHALMNDGIKFVLSIMLFNLI